MRASPCTLQESPSYFLWYFFSCTWSGSFAMELPFCNGGLYWSPLLQSSTLLARFIIMESATTTENKFVQKLPNATTVLVWGIISIPTCFCYGIPRVAMAIIAIVLSNRDRLLYRQNPQAYEMASYNNLNAGRICAIIGLCLGGLFMVYTFIVLAFYGALLGVGTGLLAGWDYRLVYCRWKKIIT